MVKKACAQLSQSCQDSSIVGAALEALYIASCMLVLIRHPQGNCPLQQSLVMPFQPLGF